MGCTAVCGDNPLAAPTIIASAVLRNVGMADATDTTGQTTATTAAFANVAAAGSPVAHWSHSGTKWGAPVRPTRHTVQTCRFRSPFHSAIPSLQGGHTTTSSLPSPALPPAANPMERAGNDSPQKGRTR